ncbi:MAG: electron transfer flavoprotein subunit alpha/FixB family protein [Elusimicrobiales bacterium]
MNKVILISDLPSKIKAIHSKIANYFKDAHFSYLLISETPSFVSIEDSFFIKSSYPLRLKIDDIASFIKSLNPDFIFSSSDIKLKSFLSILAAALDTGMLSDISEITVEDGKIFFLKPYFKNLTVKLSSSKKPILVSLKSLSLEDDDFKYTPKELSIKNYFSMNIEKCKADEYIDIEKAKKVIGIGRGVRKEDIDLIKIFAQKINAVIGYTRPVREELGISIEYQIGISGRCIAADLYIAVGISGKEYHMEGVKKVKKIIAVNTDINAPIKRFADYFINSDYRIFIEKLI